jgi:hypothetical protein
VHAGDFMNSDAHIRRKPKPLHVANRRNLLPNDLDGCIGHPRKNFKRSRKVNLIHPLVPR